MRGERCLIPLTDRLNIGDSLPAEKCSAVNCNVIARQLYRDARRLHEAVEFETPYAEAWFCKSCRAKQQENAVHCGWCDHTLDSNESTRHYYYRDDPGSGNGLDGKGPLIPICSHCAMVNLSAEAFAAAVGEASLYDEPPASVAPSPEPVGDDEARRVLSEAESAFVDS